MGKIEMKNTWAHNLFGNRWEGEEKRNEWDEMRVREGQNHEKTRAKLIKIELKS